MKGENPERAQAQKCITAYSPYFFDDILTGVYYNNFLINELQVLLEDVATRIRMWFQHMIVLPSIMTVEFKKHERVL